MPLLLIKCKMVKTRGIIKNVNVKLKQGLSLNKLCSVKRENNPTQLHWELPRAVTPQETVSSKPCLNSSVPKKNLSMATKIFKKQTFSLFAEPLPRDRNRSTLVQDGQSVQSCWRATTNTGSQEGLVEVKRLKNFSILILTWSQWQTEKQKVYAIIVK